MPLFSQEPWLTEEELKTHPLGPLRKELAPLAVGYVEDAIQELTESLDSSTVYNPFKEVDIDGYGKVLIHGERSTAYPSSAPPATEERRTPSQELEDRDHLQISGVLVCHLPGVDVGVVINQPEGVDQAVPILNEEMDGDELDFFRQTLEETIAEFVQTTSKVSSELFWLIPHC
ncbi:uncharacterized protein EMH_0014040 [Eimeria mitis]|uniref:Uncharacterized protein n=1 Tax=Eimeria mitis TaxID=44415 RepID=U6K9M6_9EIME|nr:uncharacterized protein EMH_0014040 [Eimeria mitis]CDJ32887.1 hypothetical protein EMH_0014040 [Eimeria mitis]